MFKWIKKTRSTIPYNDFAEYYIGSEAIVKGNFKTDQDIFIDGKYQGNINTTGVVELAKNSKVNAKIRARSTVIEGFFEGNVVSSEELRITSCATVNGELETSNLIVEKNAIINSNIKMLRSK